MLDPLTAVGLAATIVQLVDFCGKVISEGRAIYHEGAPLDNVELEMTTRDMVNLITDIKWTYHGENTLTGLNNNEKALVELAKSAAAVARELIEALDKLKATDGPRLWSSIVQALRTVLSRGKIDEIAQRLGLLRSQLETRLLVSLRNSVDAQAIKNDSRFADLDKRLQEVISLILDQNAAVFSKLDERDRVIISRHDFTDNLIRQSHNEIIMRISQLAVASNSSPRARSNIIPVDIAPITAMRTVECVLDHLRYVGMDNREQEVAVTYKETFKWILSDSPTTYQAVENLMQWLRHGKGCYWIHGKAASGKSTLMKYIMKQRDTKEALRSWAGEKDLITCSFFFWNLGTRLQKSHEGLLRSILHSVLSRRNDLVTKVLPGLYNQIYNFMKVIQYGDYNRAEIANLSENEIKIGFLRLFQQATYLDAKFCIFVDGVDEFEGDHAELAAMFKSIASPCVKFVVASRPIMACKAAFDGFPGLRLQDLTRPDITFYVTDQMNQQERMPDLRAENDQLVKEFIGEVVDKAQGVFLWIILVVKSLVRGLQNFDSVEDLRRRLDDCPEELERLYEHMLNRMEPLYRQQAARYFRIVLRSIEIQRSLPLSLLQMSFAIEDNLKEVLAAGFKSLTKDEAKSRCKRTDARITSRCCGLIEARDLAPTSTVTFLHMSVSDFLQSGERWAELILRTSNASFKVDESLLSSSLFMAKSYQVTRPPPESWGATNTSDQRASQTAEQPSLQVWYGLREQVRNILKYCGYFESNEDDTYVPYLLDLDRVMSERVQRQTANTCCATWGSLLGLTPLRQIYFSNLATPSLIFVHFGMSLALSEHVSQYEPGDLARYHPSLLAESVDLRLCQLKPEDTGSLVGREGKLSRILSILLNHGFDPNLEIYEKADLTAWQLVLSQLYKNQYQVEVRSLQIFVELLIQLAEAGASPKAKVCIPLPTHLRQYGELRDRTISAVQLLEEVHREAHDQNVGDKIKALLQVLPSPQHLAHTPHSSLRVKVRGWWPSRSRSRSRCAEVG